MSTFVHSITSSRFKRCLSMVLCICMVLSMCPIPQHVHAEGICEHHPVHTAECGYVEEVLEQPCRHTHDGSCGYQKAQACSHSCGDGLCGYQKGQKCGHVCGDGLCNYREAHSCIHVCGDGLCNYREARACSHSCGDGLCNFREAVACDHLCGEECAEGCVHSHDDGTCSYRKGKKCDHEHSGSCGYQEARACDHSHSGDCKYQKAVACDHVCSSACGYQEAKPCDHNHSDACGYKEARDCQHTHDASCGYTKAVKGHPCEFYCEACNAKPEETKPEATQPEATQPEATQPEATQPEATQPEATQPEATEATEATAATEETTEATEGTEVTEETTEATEATEATEETTEATEGTEATEETTEATEATEPELCDHGNEGECRLCLIQSVIDALPETASITEENLDAAKKQLEDAMAAVSALSEEEQQQLKLEKLEALNAYIAGLPKLVTGWQWVDEEEYIDPVYNRLLVTFASIDYPMYLSSVLEVLPVELLATVEGEEETLTLGEWSCDDYPTAGGYEGSYVFQTSLPEGYVLAEDAEALKITVVFDGIASTLEEEHTHSFDENGYCADCGTQAVATVGGAYYLTIQEAFDEANTAGGTLKLLDNGTLGTVSSRALVTGSFTLDLNGKNLSGYINVNESGSLTIQDSQFSDTSTNKVTARIANKGTLTIECGCFEVHDSNPYFNHGKMYVRGGKLTSAGSVIQCRDGELTVSDGTFDAATPILCTGGKATISGGEFHPSEDGRWSSYFASAQTDVYEGTSGTIIVEGGTFYKGNGANDKGFSISGGGTITVSGGEYPNGVSLSTGTEGMTLADILKEGFLFYGADGVVEDNVTSIDAPVTVQKHTHSFTYTYLDDSQHTATCSCGYSVTEDHDFAENGACVCGVVQVKYLAADQSEQTAVCQLITSDTTELTDGWYVAQGNVAITGSVTATGNANLILADGCNLTVSGDFLVQGGKSLNIYMQSGGTGSLTISGSTGLDISGSGDVSVGIYGGRIVVNALINGSGEGKMTLSSSAGSSAVIYCGEFGYRVDDSGFHGVFVSPEEYGEIYVLGSSTPCCDIVIPQGSEYCMRFMEGASLSFTNGRMIQVPEGSSLLLSGTCSFPNGIAVNVDLRTILDYGYAFQDSSGSIIELTGEKSLSGSIKLVDDHECSWEYTDPTAAGHTRYCDVCGRTFTEPHRGDMEQGMVTTDTTHSYTCDCGVEVTEEHTWEYWYDGADFHAKRCTGCGRFQEGIKHDFTSGDCACGAVQVSYSDATGAVQGTAGCIKLSSLEGDSYRVSLDSGWYLVDNTDFYEFEIDDDVNLVLANGCSLQFAFIHNGGKLTIWQQPAEAGKATGKLVFAGSEIAISGRSATIKGGVLELSGISKAFNNVPTLGSGMKLSVKGENGYTPVSFADRTSKLSTATELKLEPCTDHVWGSTDGNEYIDSSNHGVRCQYCGIGGDRKEAHSFDANGFCDCGAVQFLDENGNPTAQYCQKLTASTGDISDGWYVVQGDVDYPGTISGTVNLVLANGSKLYNDKDAENCQKIQLDKNAKLTVYSQSTNPDMMGKLESKTIYQYGLRASSITINGGNIHVEGMDWAVSGRFTVNGGIVELCATNDIGYVSSGMPSVPVGMRITIVKTEGEEPVTDREGDWSKEQHVIIQPCTDHSVTKGSTYIDENTHKRICAYCETSVEGTGAHDFGTNGVCNCGLVQYLDENGEPQTQLCQKYTQGMENGGWYVLDKNESNWGFWVEKDANLILAKGVTLNSDVTLYGVTLTVYGQPGSVLSLGALSAESDGTSGLSILGGVTQISTVDNYQPLTLTVNGGIVTVGTVENPDNLTVNNQRGIYLESGVGHVAGDFTLSQSFTLAAGQTLTIPTGAKLTIASQNTRAATSYLENNGKIYVDGELSGDVTGNGVVYYLVTLPKGVTAKLEDGTDLHTYNSKLYARAGQTIVLSGGKEKGYLVSGSSITGSTFTMEAKVAEVTEHTHSFNNDGFCKVCDGCMPAKPNNGVYEIGNAGQLFWFAGLVNGTLNGVVKDNTAKGKLTADITIPKKKDGTDRTWTPIGNYENYYYGTFDGADHTVSNLRIVSSDGITAGLFGWSSGTIQNVKLVNASGDNMKNIAGGICGKNNDGGAIKNCSVVSVSWTNCLGANLGSVCGLNHGSIENCTSTGSTMQYEYKNSSEDLYLCGASGGGKLSGCTSDSGICTQIYKCTVSDCYSSGTYFSGSISENATVEDCYTTGSKFATVIENGANITNCYYQADSETDNSDGTTAKTAAQFKSGEVAYLLNGDGNTLIWIQNLSGEQKDSYPRLGSEEQYRVYKTDYCPTYSNDANNTNPHSKPNDGTTVCPVCGTQFVASVTIDDVTSYYTTFLGAYYYINYSAHGRLTLLANAVNTDGIEGEVSIAHPFDLELNGKTLNVNADIKAKELYGVSAELNILGEGNLNLAAGKKLIVEGGTVNIQGGTINGSIQVESSGTLNISGGEFVNLSYTGSKKLSELPAEGYWFYTSRTGTEGSYTYSGPVQYSALNTTSYTGTGSLFVGSHNHQIEFTSITEDTHDGVCKDCEKPFSGSHSGDISTGFCDICGAGKVSYVDANGVDKGQQLCIPITAYTTELKDNLWYVVKDKALGLSKRLTVKGTVNLILMDNKSLTVGGGIEVGSGQSLTIWSQSNGTGSLTCQKCDHDAGIGGTKNGACGTVIINGGNITTTGGGNSAGIGGSGDDGRGFVLGNIEIRGGNVTATGGSFAPGIGGGRGRSAGTIVIMGGTVTATGNNGAPGIGGGLKSSYSNAKNDGDGGDVSISNATVIANGIGGPGGNGNLTISSNSVVISDNIKDQTQIGNWNGVVFIKDAGKVYGDVTLSKNLIIPDGKSLTLDMNGNSLELDGAKISLGEGSTLKLSGNGSFPNGVSVTGGTLLDILADDVAFYTSETDDATIVGLSAEQESVTGQGYLRSHTHNWKITGISMENHTKTCTCVSDGLQEAHSFSGGACACGCLQVDYVALDGTTQKATAFPIPTPDGSNEVTLDGSEGKLGWYVAQGTIPCGIRVNGNVNLILADGATLGSEEKSIWYQTNSSTLTIWGQEQDTGKLTLKAIDSNSGNVVSERLTINGGSVEVNAPKYSAINVAVTVNRGALEATANTYAAICADVTITGGTLNASSKYYAIEGNVTVNGGTLTAEGVGEDRDYAVAIYGNVVVNNGTLNVSSSNHIAIRGDVTVNDGELKAYSIVTNAIFGDNVKVNGGTLTATTDSENKECVISCKICTVSGGTLNATAENAYAITATSMTVSGGQVNASSRTRDAVCSSEIIVTGGQLIASSDDGTGVYSSSKVTVSGGQVIASSIFGTITANGNGIIIAGEMNNESSNTYIQGLIQVGTAPCKVYGAPAFEELSIGGETDKLTALHVLEGASLENVAKLTNNSAIYVDIGGTLGCNPEGTGSVYYQVKTDDKTTVTAEPADNVTTLDSCLYAKEATTLTFTGKDGQTVDEWLVNNAPIDSDTYVMEAAGITVNAHAHSWVYSNITASTHDASCEDKDAGYEHKLENAAHVFDSVTGACICGAGNVTYLLTDNVTTATAFCLPITKTSDNSTLTLGEGWYVVRKGQQTVNLDIQGDVNVILEDGATLASETITIAQDATLTIWAQSKVSLADISNSKVGKAMFASASGAGKLIFNGGGVQAIKTMESTDSGVQNECNVEVTVNNGLIYGIVNANGGFFHKNVTVNGGTLVVASIGSTGTPLTTAPIVADLIVNGGAAIIQSSNCPAITGNLIANSGTAMFNGTVSGILYSDIPNADAIVIAQGTAPTIGGTIGEETKSWSGFLGDTDEYVYVVHGEPSIHYDEFPLEGHLYIPEGTKLTTNGKLTITESSNGVTYAVLVAGELDGAVTLEGSNFICYALTGDTDVLTSNAAVLGSYDNLSFAKEGETINLPEKEHDGWLINGKFTQKQVTSFQMPARATKVESHTHDFGDSSQCSCGMNEVGYTAPAAKTLTYNGNAQELVEGNVITGGTMYYKLDGGEYTTSIPTATDAGSYTVTYKIVGDENYTSVEPQTVDVTIGKKSIAEADITLDGELTYNGTKQTQSITSVEVDGLAVPETDYAVSNNTRTEAGEQTLTVTVSDSSTNFTGTATKSFTVKKADNSWTTKPTVSDWTYGEANKVKSGAASFGNVQVSYYQGETELTEAPVNAGSYKVRFTVAESNNYKELTKELSFTINRRELHIASAVNTYGGRDYDGTNVVVLHDFTFGNSEVVGSDDVYVDMGDNGLKGTLSSANAGTYTEVTLQDTLTLYGDDAGNYTLVQPTTVVPTTVTISPKPITVTITPNGGTYGGTINPATATLDGVVTGQTVSVKLTYTNDGSYNSPVVPSDAGKYTVTATIRDGNYQLTGETTASFEVGQATNSWKQSPVAFGTTYGTAAALPDYEAAFGNDTVKVTYSADGTTYSETAPTAAGSYKARFTVADTTNYGELEMVVDFTISKKSITVTITPNGGSYGDVTAATAVAKNVEAGDTVEVTLTYTGTANDGSDWNNTKAPEKAGTYTVEATIADSNYVIAETKASFVVERATVKTPAGTSKVFNGEKQTADITDTDKYTVATNEGGIAVDRYDVVLTLKDSNNYRWDEKGGITSFEITKLGTNSWSTEPSIDDWTYGSAASIPSFEARFGEVKVEYSSDGVTYSETVPTAAGDYKVRFTVEATGNYGELEKVVDFTISPKKLTVTITPNGGTYGGTITAASAKVEGLVGSDDAKLTLTYTGTANDGTDWNDTKAPEKAGTYTVEATIANSNYTIAKTTASFVVNKADVTTPTVDSKVYNGSVQKAEVPADERYNVTTNNGGTDVGTYDVVMSLTDSANYQWDASNGQTSFQITKATNTWGTEPSVKNWIYGESNKVSSGKPTFGTVAVTYFQGETQLDAVPTKAGSYKVSFAVADTKNYSGLSAEKEFTIGKKVLTVENVAVNDKQYDGLTTATFKQQPTLKGVVEGDTVELTGGTPSFESAEVKEGITVQYEAFQISDTENYELTQPASTTANIYNSFTPVDREDAEGGQKGNYTTTTNDWTNQSFVVTAEEGSLLSLGNTDDADWGKTLTVASTQANQGEKTLSFYVRDIDSKAISQVVTETYRIDVTAPAGTILFDEKDETESSPRIIYKKADVAVAVTGSDTLSGVASVSYLVSDVDKNDELKTIDWKTEASSTTEARFTIEAVNEAKCFVYAKVVDKAGNVAYFRANQILFDTIAPSITGVNGEKTYYTTQTATVTDTHLKTVSLGDMPVASPITLPGDVEKSYIITATDEAGNETTVTVTMKTISSITEPAKDLTKDNVTEDDRKTLDDLTKILEDLMKPITDDEENQKLQEEQKKLEDELHKLEDLLNVLDRVKELEELLKKLPDPDTVEPDDEDAEQQIKGAQNEFDGLSDHEQELVDDELKQKLKDLLDALVDYRIISGNGSIWNRGSGKTQVFIANGQLKKFLEVKLDGVTLSDANYTKEAGSTIITLKPEFLQSLKLGSHTIQMLYTDGQTKEGSFSVKQSANYLDLTGNKEFKKQTEVWINGKSYPIEEIGGRYVNLPKSGDLLTVYTYLTGSAEGSYSNYPTGMKVYRINRSEKGTTVKLIPELNNLLRYSGCSIRVTGNSGIRMITSLTQDNKNALTGKGLAGFKLVEYGTVVQWADTLGDQDLTLSTGKHNYAYKKGVADPVYNTTGSLTQYTNVLVGFSKSECKKDIVMRPYIILKDAAGNRYTLYGGCVTRSISYIAWQNRNTYQPGTDAYNYVHELMGKKKAG